MRGAVAGVVPCRLPPVRSRRSDRRVDRVTVTSTPSCPAWSVQQAGGSGNLHDEPVRLLDATEAVVAVEAACGVIDCVDDDHAATGTVGGSTIRSRASSRN